MFQISDYTDAELEAEIAAAKASYYKWDSIASGIGIDAKAKNCALCELHAMDTGNYPCTKCSLSILYVDCNLYGVYSQWANHMLKCHSRISGSCFEYKFMVFCPTCRALAINMKNKLQDVHIKLLNELDRRKNV